MVGETVAAPDYPTRIDLALDIMLLQALCSVKGVMLDY
jgi:hypothetical protein